jgi:hypothetical protein
MDILPAIALITAMAEKAKEAQSEQEARRVLKEIWDVADQCLSQKT